MVSEAGLNGLSPFLLVSERIALVAMEEPNALLDPTSKGL